MLPFCGYNMGDYFAHWLEIGRSLAKPPRIFRVNWFRRGDDARFLWPGFGQNMRVLQWIISRCEGQDKAVRTPIGWIPTKDSLRTENLGMSPEQLEQLFAMDIEGWRSALRGQAEFFTSFGDRLPKELREEHEALGKRLEQAQMTTA